MTDRAEPPSGNGRIGVLLVNLGTPDGTDPASVRRYLREFLSDRRVIEASPFLWQPVLNLVVLPFRARRTAAAYAAIWDRARDESPLYTITRAQAEGLGARLRGQDSSICVDWAMRYGRPAIGERLDALHGAGCDRVLICPLYPQYSATTTASVLDAAFRALMRRRHEPAIRTLPPYYAEPTYIAALADSVRGHITARGWEPDVLLASFHGLPETYVAAGDPYREQCLETARLLRAALGWDEARLMVSFQSRFGPAQWLRPYTDETLAGLTRSGVRNVLVLTPGFAADCLETLEEIAIGGRGIFLEAGGRRYSTVPCLNAGEPHLALLQSLVLRELAGWTGEG